MSREERLKLVFMRATDSIKNVNNLELSSCFADMYEKHQNTIQNCVINSLALLDRSFEECLTNALTDSKMTQLLQIIDSQENFDIHVDLPVPGKENEENKNIIQELHQSEISQLENAIQELSHSNTISKQSFQETVLNISNEMSAIMKVHDDLLTVTSSLTAS